MKSSSLVLWNFKTKQRMVKKTRYIHSFCIACSDYTLHYCFKWEKCGVLTSCINVAHANHVYCHLLFLVQSLSLIVWDCLVNCCNTLLITICPNFITINGRIKPFQPHYPETRCSTYIVNWVLFRVLFNRITFPEWEVCFYWLSATALLRTKEK